MVDLPLDAALARRAREQTVVEIRGQVDQLLAIPSDEVELAVDVIRAAAGLMGGARPRAACLALADGLAAGDRDALTCALVSCHRGHAAVISDRQ